MFVIKELSKKGRKIINIIQNEKTLEMFQNDFIHNEKKILEKYKFNRKNLGLEFCIHLYSDFLTTKEKLRIIKTKYLKWKKAAKYEIEKQFQEQINQPNSYPKFSF